ncbi:hypothetical protein AQS8620_01314 [Aquimixticola soesokkakensis]|uniref:Uncharacterized protein n=1 Tax=Aquimixticola soesokkakensis TaxID=1519096 RepID=A0A1Y5SB44_9RHOB|nr:hypothetical protein [Aquimixticola soesokkakensis]SLN36733.1 hypothetical protein AQS8620_01314 [Aquimixticola soesokkakensis]
MENESAEKTGKAAVREHLIDRLDEAGFVRRKGVSAEMHEKFKARLAEVLGYLDVENIKTLAEVMIEQCGDAIWPAEVTFRTNARALQEMPAEEARIVSSWLASIEGPQAEVGGYLVELYRWLVQHRRPPLAMDMRQLKLAAEQNNRHRTIINERIARDGAGPEDRDWLSRYLADQDRARRVVAIGRQKRADGSTEGAAA